MTPTGFPWLYPNVCMHVYPERASIPKLEGMLDNLKIFCIGVIYKLIHTQHIHLSFWSILMKIVHVESLTKTMAQTLVAYQVHVLYPVGKPGGRHFEEIIPKLAAFLGGHIGIPCLSEFITERSWLFFHLVQRGTAWLTAVNERPRRMARGHRVPFHM